MLFPLSSKKSDLVAIAQLEYRVSAIDISGTGGTNFAKSKTAVAKKTNSISLKTEMTTLTSLMEAQGSHTPIIASGGVRALHSTWPNASLRGQHGWLSGEMLHLVRKDDSFQIHNHTVQTWKEQLTTILVACRLMSWSPTSPYRGRTKHVMPAGLIGNILLNVNTQKPTLKKVMFLYILKL